MQFLRELGRETREVAVSRENLFEWRGVAGVGAGGAVGGGLNALWLWWQRERPVGRGEDESLAFGFRNFKRRVALADEELHGL